MCLIKKIFAHQLKPTIIVIWDAYIKLVAFHYFMKGFQDLLECVNENKCVIFFDISAFRWQSGIYTNVYNHLDCFTNYSMLLLCNYEVFNFICIS